MEKKTLDTAIVVAVITSVCGVVIAWITALLARIAYTSILWPNWLKAVAYAIRMRSAVTYCRSC